MALCRKTCCSFRACGRKRVPTVSGRSRLFCQHRIAQCSQAMASLPVVSPHSGVEVPKQEQWLRVWYHANDGIKIFVKLIFDLRGRAESWGVDAHAVHEARRSGESQGEDAFCADNRGLNS